MKTKNIEDEDEVIRLYTIEKISIANIAKMLKINQKTISKFLKSKNIKIKYIFTEEHKEKMRGLNPNKNKDKNSCNKDKDSCNKERSESHDSSSKLSDDTESCKPTDEVESCNSTNHNTSHNKCKIKNKDTDVYEFLNKISSKNKKLLIKYKRIIKYIVEYEKFIKNIFNTKHNMIDNNFIKKIFNTKNNMVDDKLLKKLFNTKKNMGDNFINDLMNMFNLKI